MATESTFSFQIPFFANRAKLLSGACNVQCSNSGLNAISVTDDSGRRLPQSHPSCLFTAKVPQCSVPKNDGTLDLAIAAPWQCANSVAGGECTIANIAVT